MITDRKKDGGYTLAGALTLLAIMSILLAMAVPLWSWVKQRDNEEELIFRGNEYVEAIARYHAKFSTYPPDIETLVKLKYLRREYLDPMTKSGKWKVLHPDALAQTGAAGTINQPGQNQNPLNPDDEEEDDDEDRPTLGSGTEEEDVEEEEPEVESSGPVVGVVSRSKKASIKVYNNQSSYNKWIFVYALPQQQRQQQGAAPRTGTPQGNRPQQGNQPADQSQGDEDDDEDEGDEDE